LGYFTPFLAAVRHRERQQDVMPLILTGKFSYTGEENRHLSLTSSYPTAHPLAKPLKAFPNRLGENRYNSLNSIPH